MFTVGETTGFAAVEVKPAGLELQAYVAPGGPVGEPPSVVFAPKQMA